MARRETDMRRFAGFALLALVVAGCGGSDSGGTTDTDVPASTTASTAAPTTTEDAAAARAAAAQAFAGTYTGQWNNTTFGSMGSVEADIAVDGDTVTLTLDLGGNVFGASDPDPVVAVFDLTSPSPYSGENELLGGFSVEIDETGHLLMTAPSVPGVGGLMMTVEGDIDPAGFSMTYQIEGLAEGTIDVAPAA
jgi:hypothetical protein